MDKQTIVFAGGGTGGHIFPAVAMAEALKEMEPEIESVFIGTANKLESRIVPSLGYRFHTVWISGLQRRFTLSNVLFPVKLLVSLLQSRSLLRRLSPAVAVGTGGYVCGPVLFAASRMGIPTLMQEQNSYPGITTRILARFVTETHVAFEETKRHLPPESLVIKSGTPVRVQVGRVESGAAKASFGFHPRSFVVLILGGSLGAASINKAVESIVQRIDDANVCFIWQTGENDFEQYRRWNEKMDSRVKVFPFITDMGEAYAAADVVVCRAGATSLAEVTAAGLPAILVPYPYATARHQHHNASVLVEAGAAEMVEDDNLDRLHDVLQRLITDEERRRVMARNAKRMGHPDAARDLAERILQLARHKGKPA
ncbi:MAG: undecaprenyldiphospho-muramoylpentapeptide beta-N-acetylglucosaminyltransferase [Chlorobi bacterium]|nr:undecaprenyldiphospho-muramoylpentapeptide beta-N-acetylglucosaminyltransferase [Chlorobiota bacterium]